MSGCVTIGINQRFFFRSGPTFNLGFAFESRKFVLEFFHIKKFSGAFDSGVTAIATLVVFIEAVFKINRIADVVRIVRTLEDINKVHNTFQLRGSTPSLCSVAHHPSPRTK